MRKTISILIAGAFLVPSLAMADMYGEVAKRVAVKISPSIVVGGTGEVVDTTGYQANQEISLDVDFRIDANSQHVTIGGAATNLFKADQGDINNPSAYVIPLAGSGIGVTASLEFDPNANGNVGAKDPDGDNELTFDGGSVPELAPDNKTWEFFTTELEEWESGHNNRFSHTLTFNVNYLFTDSELPVGNYSGWVKLYAWIPGQI